ncbi:hypothetical protein WR25_11566 [Diploscapter pachys]|uniref:leucine--tRNA ligase n=1 Tax=Diploscapter pachys TaxID=2018661 RepID=A0A2A2JPT6_9BILA|nr:hypothetical protein WR25_11566 [Diploscapter pachys]
MFPYPSGALHMGHMRVYTISDSTARYFRLNGFDVIHPIGWDAFGLPAENAARDHGLDPAKWTKSNIASMKEQLSKTGVLFDWEREIFTCEPNFYKWTQWIFLQLHKHGLVKRTLAEVNWDPVDGTVLAAEQIDSNGRSWRSGAVAEKRTLRQWMVETPKYAKRLSEGLTRLHQWGTVSDYQSNWIGICDAYRFILPLRDENGNSMESNLDLRLLYPEDLANAGFILLRQGHPLSDKTKEGTREPYLLPIEILNGITGDWLKAVVVPHSYQKGPPMLLDARVSMMDDLEIAAKFDVSIYSKTKRHLSKDDIQEIARFGDYGGYETSRTLQDWVVSRQRSWGTPIPMYLSEDGLKAAPVETEQLPIIRSAPKSSHFIDHKSLGKARFDTDTLDTFFDSSWYFLRYLDPRNEKELASKEVLKTMPVDVYIGGIEHAAVHMFFARFVSYFLKDIGVLENEEPFSELIPQGIVRGQTFLDGQTGKYLKPSEVIQNEKGDFTTTDGKPVDVEYEKMSKSKNNGVDPLTVLERDGIDLARLQLLHAAGPRQVIDWGEIELKGLRSWLDRVGRVVSVYIEQRQKHPNGQEGTKETGFLLGKGRGKKEDLQGSQLDEALKETYNSGTRATSMSLEVMHLHNLAIMRLIKLTNALMKLPPEAFSTSLEAERCVEALVIMMQIFCPNAAAEFWEALSTVPRLKCLDGQGEDRKGLVSQQKWPQIDADADVEFVLIVNNIGCGRVLTPRQQIEHLSREAIFARAKAREHQDVFDRILAKRHIIDTIHVEKRPGLHVTLKVELKGDLPPTEIQIILNEKHSVKNRSRGKKLAQNE